MPLFAFRLRQWHVEMTARTTSHANQMAGSLSRRRSPPEGCRQQRGQRRCCWLAALWADKACRQGDPIMNYSLPGRPPFPPWLRGLIALEMLFDVPFFFVAIFAFANSAGLRLRTPTAWLR